MGNRITLEITKGALAGQSFDYSEPTRIFIGRQEDCGIVLPESTVSRYHCVLEISPPEVKLQDFGSLNGTFLNGEKIGQRDRRQSWEQAREEHRKAYILHDGDVLGLGSQCEFSIHIEAAARCAGCGKALRESAAAEGTVLDGQEDDAAYYNDAGQRVCADCHLMLERARIGKLLSERKAKEAENQRLAEEARKAAQEAQRIAAEAEQARKDEEARETERQRQAARKQKQAEAEAKRKRDEQERIRAQAEQNRLAEEARKREKAAGEAEAARRRAEQQRMEAEKLAAEMAAQLAAKPKPMQKKCAGCGRQFTPKAPDDNLCENCLADPAKILDAILHQFIADAKVQPTVNPGTSAIVAGFDKVSLLGKGGMGEVWKVKERKTGKLYALKTMLRQEQSSETAQTLFLREASVCRCLKHRNVVKAYQTGCANGTFYILMDLCEGGSVDGLMERMGGKLPLELATYIILQVLAGLDYVHNMDIDVEIRKGAYGGTKEVDAKGIVHRDFKPGNIFLSDKSDHPIAMVADFGMAKAFDTAGFSRVTKTGTVMGTPVFMPRQQALNFKYAKPEVDVWAAAASYYNMLTGAFPKKFSPTKNPWQVIVGETAVPIRERCSSIPQKLAAVIDRALVERPEIEYKSAAALRRDIIAALPDHIKAAVKGAL